MDLYERALRKIKADQRCKKNMVIVGPTGPTGATARLFKSSNKNNHRFKPNNSLYQKKEVHFYTSISYF